MSDGKGDRYYTAYVDAGLDDRFIAFWKIF